MSNSGTHYKSLDEQFAKILEPLTDGIIQEECGEAALKICREYKPDIRSSTKAKVKSEPSGKPASRLYVNCYTAKPMKDMFGVYGARLKNKKYQLSHLLEHSHFTGGKHIGYAKTDYELYGEIEQDMKSKFEQAVKAIVDKYL